LSELSPDIENTILNRKGPAWEGASAAVSNKGTDETKLTVTTSPTNSATSDSVAPGTEFTSSRYEWNPNEFTPKQRRLSESNVALKVRSRSPGSAVPEPVRDESGLFEHENDAEEIHEHDAVDEEGFPLKPFNRRASLKTTSSTGGENEVPSSSSTFAGVPRRSISPTRDTAVGVTPPAVGSVGVKKYSGTGLK
jgi:hypothetical protein